MKSFGNCTSPKPFRAAESPFPWAEPNYPFQIAIAGGVDFFQDQATLRARLRPNCTENE